MSVPVRLHLYLYFISCGQSDDDHVRSKHVPDLKTKYVVFFMGDFRLPSRCSSELHSSGLLRSDYSLCNNPEKCSYPIVF